MLIYVDNLLLTAGDRHRRLSLWRALVCLALLGVPFAYKHVCTWLDYVGFALDYTRFSMPSYTVGYTSYVKLNRWSVVVRFSHSFHELHVTHVRLGDMPTICSRG